MYTNALQFLLHRSRKFLGIYNTGDQPFKASITANHRRSTLKRPLDSPSQVHCQNTGWTHSTFRIFREY